MRSPHWLMTAVLGLLLTGCATMHTPPAPEARQALAPTGKLRVGVFLGNPASVIRNSASGEMKGVAFDLGKKLAARLGVPFEQIVSQYHRRQFPIAAGAFLVVPRACAQHSALPVIGYLSNSTPGPSTHIVAAFRHGLGEVGYVEGKNVAIEFRWASRFRSRSRCASIGWSNRKTMKGADL